VTDSVYTDGAYGIKNAIKSLQIGKHMPLFHPGKMPSLGKIQKPIRKEK